MASHGPSPLLLCCWLRGPASPATASPTHLPYCMHPQPRCIHGRSDGELHNHTPRHATPPSVSISSPLLSTYDDCSGARSIHGDADGEVERRRCPDAVSMPEVTVGDACNVACESHHEATRQVDATQEVVVSIHLQRRRMGRGGVRMRQGAATQADYLDLNNNPSVRSPTPPPSTLILLFLNASHKASSLSPLQQLPSPCPHQTRLPTAHPLFSRRLR